MATEISNGKQTVKLYSSVNRGKAMYQLAYYAGGRRVQKNFADKSEAKRVARQILGGLTNDAKAVEALATPELESLVAARRVLAPSYALHVAVEEHAQAVSKLGKATLREAVEFFLRHNRADVPRLTLDEIAEQFANSRQQSGLSAHYVSQCRKTIRDLAEIFPGRALPDLKTSELDAWLGALPFRAKTKNGMRIILMACGNWAECRGYLVKDGSPFPAMVRYKETKAPVAIFTPEQIAGLLAKADASLCPFLAIGAFAGLRMAELQRLDWREIDLDRGFITVDASKAKTRQRRLVPISDNLKLWLTPHKQTSGPVCLHQRPQLAAARLCEGFSWQENGLRHSFISYRLAILHDTARVALEAGNSPEVIFGHYRELVTPEAAHAWFNTNP
ncbi:MAG: tyrosine-type recombinase/integrase [Methylacidiphilales bacterium]|nr:tyrosine-type recombinase/integrase [Candidatus Methylacidiphilales bacterium]